MTDTKRTVVFIHGLWLHADSWTPWPELFETAGYPTLAPGWPTEGDTVELDRADPQSIANCGVDEAAKHYAAIIDKLPEKPILIGHSFGGLLAEKLLGDDHAAAAVAIDAAQIKGVLVLPLSTLRSTARCSGTRRVSGARSRWPPSSSATASATRSAPRSPTRCTPDGASRPRAAVTRATLKQYRKSSATTDLVEFPDRGHSLVVDSRWREVADACLSWLAEHEL